MKLGVTIYMQARTCLGYVDLPMEERLTDLLNKKTVEQPLSTLKFLQIIQATITHADRSKEILASVIINKAAIQLIAIRAEELASDVSAKLPSKTSLLVKKKPFPVRLSLPDYELRGKLHCTSKQTVQDLLEVKEMFLPVTDVRIRSLFTDARWNAPFISVNRELILTLQKEEGTLVE